MKCWEVVFIRVKIKGYLRNITENELYEFEEKGIKNKNKITYTNDNIKNTIKINGSEVMLIREGNDFVSTFVFNKDSSCCNYLLKDNNYDVDIDIISSAMEISDNYLYVRYVVVDSNCEYEYKVEMSDI